MEVRKIYFDMDGVLADFERGVRELCNLEPLSQNAKHRDKHKDDIMWEKIKEVEHFYYLLNPVQNAKELFDSVYERYKERCEILTGIPKPHREINHASEDKKRWVRENLSEDVAVNIVYREEKQNYVHGKGCVLIDDSVRNIREWNEAGGTGILFKDATETIEILKGMGIL